MKATKFWENKREKDRESKNKKENKNAFEFSAPRALKMFDSFHSFVSLFLFPWHFLNDVSKKQSCQIKRWKIAALRGVSEKNKNKRKRKHQLFSVFFFHTVDTCVYLTFVTATFCLLIFFSFFKKKDVLC